MNYMPEMKPAKVVEKGEFVFSAAAFDHGHIYGQVNGLAKAGGVLKSVYEPAAIWSPQRRSPMIAARWA